MEPQKTFTGLRRERKTSRKVRITEFAARWLITIGGIGTIIAVATICIFLVWVVVPLFQRSGFDVVATPRADLDRGVAGLAADEYGRFAIVIHRDASASAVSLDDGTLLDRRPLTEGGEVTAVSFDARRNAVALGFADGSVRLGTVKMASRRVEAADAPADVRNAGTPLVRVADASFERLPDGNFRKQTLSVEMQPSVKGDREVPVTLIATGASSGRAMLAVWRKDGSAAVSEVRTRENMATGEITLKLETGDLAAAPTPRKEPPAHLFISDLGDTVLAVWPDGYTVRHDTRDLSRPRIAEVFDLAPPVSDAVASATWMIGTSTLVVGGASGAVEGWFRTKPDTATTSDGGIMTRAHVLESGAGATTAVGVSRRNRLFVTGHADGTVRVHNMTAGESVGTAKPFGEPILAVDMFPRNDGVVAVTRSGFAVLSLHADYAEVTVTSILRPVWYEGYGKPEHVWQSSSGSDDFEAKFGLVPLVFGTLKATFYALLFAVPIALLAAIATSEFLHPRVKARVKPAIEMMASLPSVVLGFVGALVLAPIVEDRVPAILAALLIVPTSFVTAAHLWQLLPPSVVMKLGIKVKAVALCLVLPAALFVAGRVGPFAERMLFGGDFKAWLSHTSTAGGIASTAFGGWFILFIPLSAVFVGWVGARFYTPALSRRLLGRPRESVARAALLRHLGSIASCLVTAAVLAGAMTLVGFDVRGGVMATYVQRNALVVGFVMGFAVIPIIYTLAEDALSSVPHALRSASLGCGATLWQTAMRVVLPTAASGIFSAVMVGLGRAVGETMVVLMAAGNTPVLEWNVFNGFRTLSANIAVELPEAVEGHVHYRMLFLAALVLFAITFVLNTLAELVRQRFRKRAYQL